MHAQGKKKEKKNEVTETGAGKEIIRCFKRKEGEKTGKQGMD